MAQPLLIPHPENATIEELKQVSQVDTNQTATRCSAMQMHLAGADRQLVCKGTVGDQSCIIERIWLTMKASRFNNQICKN